MSKETEQPEKECRAIRLSRRHVQMFEIVGSDGLQDRTLTFGYYATNNPDSEELMEAARRFTKEAQRLFITPEMTGGKDE